MRVGLALPLEAGRFRSLAGGRTVVYARSADASGELRDVFIKRGSGRAVEVTTARRARRAVSADGLTQVITLYDGERHEGVPGSPQFRFVRFAEQQLPVNLPPVSARSDRVDQLPTRALWGSGAARHRAELQWRMGLAVMGLVLALCAVPLARLRPRQGRYARVWLAVLLFALYANLASAMRVWMDRGVVSPRARPVVRARAVRPDRRGAAAAAAAAAAGAGCGRMILLDRYIARTLLGAIGLVMAVLVVLGALFLSSASRARSALGTTPCSRRWSTRC